MYKLLRTFIPATLIIFLLASCHTAPKHARFIPKDALAVIGIHTGEMRKELAWSAITGSNLLDEMREKGNNKAPEMLKDVENSGLDFSSVIYLYTKPDKRFSSNMRTAAIAPVADEKKLTAYIQKHAPSIAIHDSKNRHEAMLDGKMYIAWNDEVLIAMNPITQKKEHNEPAKIDSIGGMNIPTDPYNWTEEIADSAATVAEMDIVFNPAKGTTIEEINHFKTLESEGHDITLWLSYDAMGEMMGNSSSLNPMGSSMANMIWKNSAMATGIDFNKGSLDADMKYYSSDSFRAVAKELAKENVDNDMLKRLPAAGLNAAIGYHLSPSAIKMMLDKMGLTGMANIALMQSGLSMDDIFGAFSGDLVASVNNFKIESKMQDIDPVIQKDYGMIPYPVTSPKADVVYSMKIGDKTKMNKLIGLLSSTEMLKQTAPNTYTFGNAGNGFTIMLNDKYFVASNTAAGAASFLKEGSATMPDAVNKQISGHVIGLWADVHSFIEGASIVARSSPSDSVAFNAVRNLFTTFTMNGGAFKDGANNYKMNLGFVNKEENSLVQLLHLAQQLSAVNNSKKEVVIK